VCAGEEVEKPGNLKTNGGIMSRNKVIEHFLTGTGFFKGDRVAWEEAQKVTKTQRREWRRKGYVPVSFLFYLCRIGIMNKRYIFRRGMTLGILLDLLRVLLFPDEQSRSAAQHIFQEIMRAEIPQPDFSNLMAIKIAFKQSSQKTAGPAVF
jgi:hypothetical protein